MSSERKNKGGRPRKLPQERRDFIAYPCFTRHEWSKLEERAAAAGLPVAIFIRTVALNLQINSLPAVNREAIVTLNRLGNNINQVAKQLNTGQVKGITAEQIDVWLNDVKASIAAAGSALHGR